MLFLRKWRAANLIFELSYEKIKINKKEDPQ